MDERVYIRDKRSPIPKNTSTSRVMSANKSKDTKPELIFRKALYYFCWKMCIKDFEADANKYLKKEPKTDNK